MILLLLQDQRTVMKYEMPSAKRRIETKAKFFIAIVVIIVGLCKIYV